MPSMFGEVFRLAREGIYNFIGLNFSEVHFAGYYRSFIWAAVIFLLICINIIRNYRKNKASQLSSGHNLSGGSPFEFLARLFFFLARTTLFLTIFVFVAALAEPFFNIKKESVEIVESRIRIDARDGSTSMESKMFGTEISKAEAAARAHADFVKMREGKKDRTSLWFFGSFPYLMEDFIIDDRNYLYQVEDIPWILGRGKEALDDYLKAYPDYYIPRERYMLSGRDSESGSTNYSALLRAIIKQLNSDEFSRNAKSKSILIISDGEPDQFPDNELQQLQKMGVVTYIILIRGYENENSSTIKALPEFADRIDQYGGKFFDVTDKNSLVEAFKEVDKMETTEIQHKVWIFRMSLVKDFILFGLILAAVFILIALMLRPFETYP